MFPMVLIISIGFLVGWKKSPSLGSINEINLNIFIPALVFVSLIEQQFDFHKYAVLALAALLLIIITGLLAIIVTTTLRTEYRTIAPTMMFHNAGNIGLPLMTLALGSEGLAAAVILFLIGNMLHFGLGTYMLDQKGNWIGSLTSPAIIAALLALALQSQTIMPADFVLVPIQMLANIAVPLMLFTLGLQLAKANFDFWSLGLSVGIISPLIGVSISLLLALILPLDNIQTAALILFSALPPAVMNFLFAQRYSQEPDKVSAIVMFGNTLAIFTLPLTLSYVLPTYT